MTEKEYGDFELLLEFKVPKGGNSGVALRSPMKGDPAYTGMEIQILDDPVVQGAAEVPAHRQHLRRRAVVEAADEAGRRVEQATASSARGGKVTIELNGEKIVDANLEDYKEKHGKQHPGILREKGHIGLQEHGGRGRVPQHLHQGAEVTPGDEGLAVRRRGKPTRNASRVNPHGPAPATGRLCLRSGQRGLVSLRSPPLVGSIVAVVVAGPSPPTARRSSWPVEFRWLATTRNTTPPRIRMPNSTTPIPSTTSSC